MQQLKALTTLACWILLVTGCVCLGFGIASRFAQFDEFKLWIGSLSLGVLILTLAGVIAFLRSRLD